MPYQNGEHVIVHADSLQSIAGQLRGKRDLPGLILQRCGPESYDVLLDVPLTPEITLLSWVPEALISPKHRKPDALRD